MATNGVIGIEPSAGGPQGTTAPENGSERGHPLDRLWRTLATGLCFAVFGLGQLLLAVTLFPPLLVFIRDKARRQRLARRIVQQSFRAFILLMRVTGVLRYRVRGLSALRQPGTLILANHPSLIDVVFLIAFVPELDCVVKSSLLRNPFTRYAVLAAGYIPHLSAEQVLESCRQTLSAGGVLLVFPEGTRTDPASPLKLQRGAAHLAVRLGRDIVPVIIRVSDHNLGKGSRWWRVPARKVSFDFEVKERMPVAPWREAGQEHAVSARELTDTLTSYFRREIATPCPSWPKK